MEKIYYDMIYLSACGVNNTPADKEVLGEVDLEKLYRISRKHFLDALVGTTLKKTGISIPQYWNEHISKAVRKVVLFDVERENLLSLMEQKGIWYMPLKGVILKKYYPAVGMRQMSDNDILFDAAQADKVRDIFRARGYMNPNFGFGAHDVYEKEPVYNFEMHRALYGIDHEPELYQYYRNVKERLLKDEGNAFGYHFSDEDFYIYILTHAYKHYSAGGTGLRTLLDFYVYLKAKPDLDFAYIEKECEVLKIAEFEKRSRNLCMKIFENPLEQNLSEAEKEMLAYYLSSGVYGTVEHHTENRMKKFEEKSGSKSKLRYMWSRIIPDMEFIKKYFPFFYKHKILLPFCWIYRIIRAVFVKDRRKKVLKEFSVVQKTKEM